MYRFLFKLIIATFLSLSCASLTAQNSIENSRSLNEVSGIIADRTITRFGRDFYNHFSHARLLNYPDSPFNLVIYERPSARWGSLIWIEFKGQKVEQLRWSPGKGTPKETAEASAKRIEEKLKQTLLKALLSDTFDLERDEI